MRWLCTAKMNSPPGKAKGQDDAVAGTGHAKLPRGTSQPALASPTIPDYELLRPIGGGAYGEVWLARSKATGALRAAKIVWRHTFEDDRPFRREFEGIQRFEQISREHPSQLALFHIGRNEAEGYFYYVMELADNCGKRSGGVVECCGNATRPEPRLSTTPVLQDPDSYKSHTLRAELEKGRLPAARVLEIGQALTEALGHLHTRGLVHRDVKPSNVIFVNGRPKLADIGLVTDASDQCSIVGTEGYLPPEGAGKPPADIFALGKVLYEAATGLDRRRYPDLPPDLREWPDIAAVLELNQIVLKACATDLRQRYYTADALHRDLTGLSQGNSVRRARQAERRWRLVGRGAVWLTAIVVVLTLMALANRLRQSALIQPAERRSTNEAANRFYDLGKANFDLFRGTNMAIAADCFEKAIQADTNFAQGYGFLAATYFWGGFEDWNPDWIFLPRAREAAQRALELDPKLAEPHLALGWYYALKEWNWHEAEKEDRRAVELNSSSWFCHLCYAELLRVIGRTNDALREIYQARERNPSSHVINVRLIDYLVCARRFQEALEQIEQAVTMEAETDAQVVWNRHMIYLALGRVDEAIKAERDGLLFNGEPKEKVELEAAAKMRIPPAEAARLIWLSGLAAAQNKNDLYDQACHYAQLGNSDAAFTCLEKLVEAHDAQLTFRTMTDWTLDPLRADPRFHAILKTMHFE
jgi:tetratricopeptide (TPR) repeat protein